MTLESLIQPISAESPTGADLSFSLEFDAILELRREEDPTLDQGEWVRALKVADWDGVVAQCETLLRLRTKDLRVAGWLTDALARTRGFAGMSEGLTLCARLCETFGENVYPRAEDGDQEQRAGSVAWLLGQIAELARGVPVIGSGSKRYGLRDIEVARARQRQVARAGADAPAAAPADGAPTLDEIARAQASTPRESLSASLAEARGALDALAHLQGSADALMGAEAPGFSAARKALEDALGSVERFARDAGVLGGDGAGTDAAADGDGTAGGSAPSSSSGPVSSRAQALQQLRAVAEFFRRTEPHSPVAYLADKAAQWGEMPLHAWLRVVLKDPNALAHVEELLGVQPATPPATES